MDPHNIGNLQKKSPNQHQPTPYKTLARKIVPTPNPSPKQFARAKCKLFLQVFSDFIL